MKKHLDLLVLGGLCVVVLAAFALIMPKQRQLSSFRLTSSAFADGGAIPAQYTCDGKNVSPPLHIANAPKGTKQFALVLFDPDAPGKGFVHWTLFNIRPAVTDIAEGKLPFGAKNGLNGANKIAYTGPCPPSGIHHYIFTLYALDTELKVTQIPDADKLKHLMIGDVLDRAELDAKYAKTAKKP